MISMVAAVCASAVSCVEQMPDVTEELLLGRCLSPTEATAPVDRTDGRTVAFTWAESKGALQYTIEIFEGAEDADPATVFAGTPMHTEVVKGSPLKKQLPSDKFYFARVKAQAPDTGIEDSKWVDFPYPIGTYEVKSNLWPEVALRTSGAVTLQWKEIDSDRVDHVRVYPNPDDASKAYKRYDVAASEGETVQTVVDGLASSVKYTFAVHFKSANRGEVVAWTRPSLDNPTVVTTSEELIQALSDGASNILVSYSDTPYSLLNADGSAVVLPVAESISIYGNATEAGVLPTVAGTINIPEGLSNIHVESLNFDGESYTYSHPIVLNKEIASSIGEISLVNCNVTGYKAGFFYYDSGSANIDKILFDNVYVNDIQGSGGNGFDIRAQVTIGSIVIKECTFSNGFRTFFRIDKATISEFLFKNNTLNNLCYVEDGNNKGLFYIGAGKGQVTIPEFVFEHNLLLNMNGNATRTVLFSDEVGVPNKVANNWYYKLGAGFWNPETDTNGDKINTEGKGKMTQTAGLAGGGQILSSDPCYDSAEGNLYVKNATVLEAKVGDPRWLQEYKPVVEDLTLAPVAAGKSWNLTDTKAFGKTVKTPVVRDGLRFIVGANPFKVSEKGLEFSAAGTVEALGVPSDAAVAFMVDTPGTVILSSIKSNTGSANGHITVAVGPADGSKAQVAGSVNVGMAKAKVALPNVDGPQIVYLYGCSPVVLTALQWSDQVASGATPVLGTPEVEISDESVDENCTDEVKLSWAAVSSAGSYKIYVNVPSGAEELPEAYAEVTGTEWSIPFKTLGFGKFEFQVQACPASDDMSREPSELSQPKTFEYCEVLKPVLIEKVWGAEDFGYLYETKSGSNKDTQVVESFVYNNLYYNNTGGKCKFGLETEDKIPRYQFGGTGNTNKQTLQFMVAGPGTLTIEYASSGTSDRYVGVAIGETEFGPTEGYLAPESKEIQTKVIDMTSEPIASGTIISVYSKGSGINVFSLKWTPKPSEEGITPDGSELADTYTLDWTNLTSAVKAVAATWDGNSTLESTDLDVTVDGVTYKAGGDKVKYDPSKPRYQFNGQSKVGEDGVPTSRFISFKIATPGTLSYYMRHGSTSNYVAENEGTWRYAHVILVKPDGTVVELDKLSTPTDDYEEGTTELRSVSVTEEHLAGLKSAPTVYIYCSVNGSNLRALQWKAE